MGINGFSPLLLKKVALFLLGYCVNVDAAANKDKQATKKCQNYSLFCELDRLHGGQWRYGCLFFCKI